jgi:GntR family transcriptional regulator
MKIEKTVDRGSKEKLYVQIYSIILDKIESGAWPAGTQIPSEDELCRIYDVSKVTVREAVQELVREGYLKRQQGKGTFVTYTVPQLGIVMRTRLSEDMQGEEVKGGRVILEKGIRQPSEEIQKILMMEGEVYYILMRQYVDEESFHEEFFIPLFILPDIENEDIRQNSVYDLIEDKGTKKIFKVTQTVEIIMMQGDKEAMFSALQGFPALQINRVLSSSDGSPIAFSRLIGSGRTYKFQMEFERIK